MPRSPSVSGLNIAELRRILGERTKQIDKLMKNRAKLQARIDEIDGEISKLSGGIDTGMEDGRAGSRARNDRPLPDYIEDALQKSGKPMRVGEIVDAVKGAGYKSNSKSFKNIVNQMLIKERKRFAQVDRGLYGLAKK